MLQFFFFPSTNPFKVALYLEETQLPYEMIPVDIRRGHQFRPEFLALNPNAKTPALIDGQVAMFDSNAILLYLSEKTGKFLPPQAQRAEFLSWMMFVASGIGPYSGQAVYFQHFADGSPDHIRQRYAYEARRHWQIIEDRLRDREFMLGDEYTVLDMAVWGWARALPRVLGYEPWEDFSATARLVDWVNARPAAERALGLQQQYDFKMELDPEALSYMFRYLPALAAE